MMRKLFLIPALILAFGTARAFSLDWVVVMNPSGDVSGDIVAGVYADGTVIVKPFDYGDGTKSMTIEFVGPDAAGVFPGVVGYTVPFGGSFVFGTYTVTGGGVNVHAAGEYFEGSVAFTDFFLDESNGDVMPDGFYDYASGLSGTIAAGSGGGGVSPSISDVGNANGFVSEAISAGGVVAAVVVGGSFCFWLLKKSMTLAIGI